MQLITVCSYNIKVRRDTHLVQNRISKIFLNLIATTMITTPTIVTDTEATTTTTTTTTTKRKGKDFKLSNVYQGKINDINVM